MSAAGQPGGGPRWGPPDFSKPLPTPTPRQAELRRVGDALRGLITGVVATEAPIDALEALADDLEQVAGRWLATHPPRTSYSWGEAAPGGDVHAFFDDSPLIGQANPIAPPLELGAEEVEGGGPATTVVGRATFGQQYEGPPGHVHGGFVAAAFDEVLGMAQSLTGRPGMTGTLTIRYRSPTPLRTELSFRGWVERVEGRKIFTSGTLHAGDRLCAEAEAVFITVDFGRIAQLAAER